MEDINFYDILNSNYKAMSDIEKAGQKDYVQYQKDIKRMESCIERENSPLNLAFNLNREEGKKMLFATGTPAMVASVVTAIGAIGVAVPLIHYVMASIEVGIPSEQRTVLKTIKDFIYSSGELSLNGLKSLAVSLVGPLLFGSIAIPKTMIDELKIENGKFASNMLPYLDDLLVMLEDLKRDKDDLSLGFIKRFLSCVDISKNKPDFNLELLYRFSEYRVSILKENDGVAKPGESSECFKDIIDYLGSADMDNGASVDFVTNSYVQNLVNTYASVDSKGIAGPKR